MVSIPDSTEEITQGWLANLLNVEDLLLLARLRLDGGFMSSLTRVDFRSSDPNLPRSIIIKLRSPFDVTLKIALAFNSYRKETDFYSNLAHKVSVRTPRCYASRIAPAGNQFLLALEDLGEREGFGMGAGSASSASKWQTMQAMRTLAGLHSTCWQKREYNLPLFAEALYASSSGLSELVERGLAKTGTVLSPPARSALSSYTQEPSMQLPAFLAVPQTLIHGDFRLSNLYFAEGEETATVIDWGDYSYGPAAFDLAVFLTSSLAAADRRAWQAEAIEEYCHALEKAGVTYNPADCRKDYGLFLPACAYLPALAATEVGSHQPSLAEELFTRLASALEDQQAT